MSRCRSRRRASSRARPTPISHTRSARHWQRHRDRGAHTRDGIHLPYPWFRPSRPGSAAPPPPPLTCFCTSRASTKCLRTRSAVEPRCSASFQNIQGLKPTPWFSLFPEFLALVDPPSGRCFLRRRQGVMLSRSRMYSAALWLCVVLLNPFPPSMAGSFAVERVHKHLYRVFAVCSGCQTRL